MNDFYTYLFSDPFIRPTEPFQPQVPAQAPLLPSEPPPEQTPQPTKPEIDGKPEVSDSLFELSNPRVIVYRSMKASEICKGPNITVPIFNLSIGGAQSQGPFQASCISTYPDQAPFSPIADRFEIRHFKDSFILTMADGCGLHPSSRLAPKAAIEGFWEYLAEQIESSKEQFDVHRFGNYLKSALKAAHFNIYWDAYFRSQEEFSNYSLSSRTIVEQDGEDYIQQFLVQRKETLSEELNAIEKALEGDLQARRSLVTKHLDSKFYEGYAGATTFMCSALLKNPSSEEYPYLLLTMNLGDGQSFIYRDEELIPTTQDTRDDLSNLRDPGGKMGLCTPIPMKMDERNLHYSLTPCRSKDLLLFMTDGVLDNLNPERLGFLPQGSLTPPWVLEKLSEASYLSIEQIHRLLNTLDADVPNWKQLTLERSNQIHSNFSKALLKLLISEADDLSTINETLTQFCYNITEGHRKPHSKNSYEYTKPLGKPDHTTCLSYQIP